MNKQTFSVVCKKGQGNAIGNMLRTLAYTRIPCWRPIAYSIDKKVTNILHSEDTILQDMLEFSSNLSKLNFSCTKEIGSDYVVEHYNFVEEFTSSHIQKGSYITCDQADMPLLNSIKHETVGISIYYRKAHGVHTVDDNLNFLSSKGESRREIKTMSSSHTVLKTFYYDVTDKNLDEEILNITISSDTIEEKELLFESAKASLTTLTNFIKNLE